MTVRERQGPLDGMRVIDISGMISGASATTVMGDFGADVVMIEHPAERHFVFGTPTDKGSARYFLRKAGIGSDDETITAYLDALSTEEPLDLDEALRLAERKFGT